MSRIQDAFKKRKAFIPFITAGDPTIEVTKQVILKMAEAGADIIEIGIPFSDPVAEGPTIQAASERALANHTNVDDIFLMVQEVRKAVDIPLVFMTYINPIFVYGVDKFLSRCQEVGVDGLITPDVPFEEKGLLADSCKKFQVEHISMIAPSSNERITMIAKEAEGFLYVVSSLGVTGVRKDIQTNVADILDKIKEVSTVPCAVGFGISTTEQAKTMAKNADGVIVGSAIVNIIAEKGEEAPEYVYQYVKEMTDAIHQEVNVVNFKSELGMRNSQWTM